jgi:MFS family permease
MLGVMIGCLVFPRLADLKGRKPLFIFGLALHIFSMVVLVLSSSVYISYIGTFLLGAATTARYFVGYAYTIELMPRNKKLFAGFL